MNISDSNILVTGGTGSFGQCFCSLTLQKHHPKSITVFSRDEMKQWEMQNKFKDPRISYMIGDVRDQDRLNYAVRNIDIVVHAAATKIVPTAEYNPDECIKTNVNGASNLITASINSEVKKVIALSTDKASSPINLYGASKLLSDKLFIASNSYNNSASPLFSVVRYGNVMGSRGSVIPFFINQSSGNILPITDSRMTRFMITLQEAVNLVWSAISDSCGGEVYVKKIPSMRVEDIARAVSPDCNFNYIGIRPGEKIHEQMIGHEDAMYTFEYDQYFKILPMIHNAYEDPERIKDGRRVDDDFAYTSDKNKQWMTIIQLQKWLKSNYPDYDL